MKILFFLIIVSFAGNCFLLYQAVKYRNIVIIRNKGYQDLNPYPFYKNSNHLLKLIKQAPDSLNKPIVFIGSSIVQRWDFTKYFSSQPYINRGIGDDTTEGIRKRFDSDVIGFSPRVAVIFTCANDIKYKISSNRSKSNLQYMLTRCEANNITPLVFVSLPVLYSVNPSLTYSRPHNEMIEMEKALISLCEKQGVEYVYMREHIAKVTEPEQMYKKDGIHLNEKGYAFLTRILDTKLKAVAK